MAAGRMVAGPDRLESSPLMQSSLTSFVTRRPRLTVAVLIGGLAFGLILAWTVLAILGWNRLAAEPFETDKVESALPPLTGSPSTTVPYVPITDDHMDPVVALALARAKAPKFPVTSPLLPDEMFTSVLLIGADASGALADVIVLVLLPEDGSAPMMVSLPRDLWLPSPCSGRFSRLNAALGGCKGVGSGPEVLSIAVERYTGVVVDHFARVNFDGFATVVDRMGGISVCVDAPTRDVNSGLDLAAGCADVDGKTALAWVRSRHAEQLVGEQWKSAGWSDFTRQRHQQDALFQLAQKLGSYSSVATLGQALTNLSSAVRMDDGWSIGDIASVGMRYHGITRDRIVRFQIPTTDYITPAGAYVLLPVERFNDTLAGVYPSAARSAG